MSQVIIQTQNSTYTFDVANWSTTVRGGILGRDRIDCLPGADVIAAANTGDASTLVGTQLVFQYKTGGTYMHPVWDRVRTSAIKGAVVLA